jgi:hypothetical protein
LKYARWDGAKWRTAVVDNCDDTGGNAITIDRGTDPLPHIAYQKNGDLYHAMPKDVFPPQPVGDFVARPLNGAVLLGWDLRHDDTDLAGVRITARTDHFPTGPQDGRIVVDRSQIPGQEDSIQDTPLSNGIAQYYAIFTYDSLRNYSEGITRAATPNSAGPIGDAANFSAQGADSQVTLSWTNPIHPAFVGVRIVARTDRFPNGENDGTIVCNKTGTQGAGDSYPHTGLVNGNTYYYTAFAYDNLGNFSGGVSKRGTPTDQTPPAQIQGFTAEAMSNRVKLTWRTPSDPEFAGVIIRWSTVAYPSGPDTDRLLVDLTALPNTDMQYIHSSIPNGQKVYYSAFACDLSRNFAIPGVQANGTPHDTLAPLPVLNFSGTATQTSVALNWDNPGSSDLDRIEIWRGKNEFPLTRDVYKYSHIYSMDPAAPSAPGACGDQGLKSDTNYYYSAFSLDEFDNASNPATLLMHTKTNPIPPCAEVTNVQSDTSTPDMVTIRWDNPNDPHFVGTRIVWRTDRAPLSPEDSGEYQDIPGIPGSSGEFSIPDATQDNYYITLYTYGGASPHVWSNGIGIIVNPTSPPDPGEEKRILKYALCKPSPAFETIEMYHKPPNPPETDVTAKIYYGQWVDGSDQPFFEIEGAIQLTNQDCLSEWTRTFYFPRIRVLNHPIHNIVLRIVDNKGAEWDQVKFAYCVPDNTPEDNDFFDETDLLALTNLERLNRSFDAEDWWDVQPETPENLLKNTLMGRLLNVCADGGQFFYVKPDKALESLQNDFFMKFDFIDIPEYLLILGGDDVIPFPRITTYLPLHAHGVDDEAYWVTYSFAYGRIPFYEDAHEENMRVAKNLLPDTAQGLSSVRLNRSVILTGRDSSDEVTDMNFGLAGLGAMNNLNQLENSPIWHRKSDDGSNYLMGYTAENLINGVLPISAHGNLMEIALDARNSNGSTFSTGTMIDFNSGLRLHNVPSPPDGFLSFNSSRQMSNTIVYAYSCDTMNLTQSSDPGEGYACLFNNHGTLGYDFLLCGAKSYFGYGIEVSTIYGCRATDSFLNHLCQASNEQDAVALGDVYYSTWGLNPGFMHFGYPKQEVWAAKKTSGSNPLTSSESFENTTRLHLDDYQIKMNQGAARISFQGSLSGQPVDSNQWIFPGNPILPYVEKVYNLPPGSVVSDLDVAYTPESIGDYILETSEKNNLSSDAFPYDSDGIYFPDPVKSLYWKEKDGSLTHIIRFFPFQYDSESGSVTLLQDLTTTLTLGNRTGFIQHSSLDRESVYKGEPFQLTVIATPNHMIRVERENSILVKMESDGATQTIILDSGILSQGYNRIKVRLFDLGEEAFQDEETFGVTVRHTRIHLPKPSTVESLTTGQNLTVMVRIYNDSPNLSKPELRIIGLQEGSRQDAGIGSLEMEPYSWHDVELEMNTLNFKPGYLRIYSEALAGSERFESPYALVELTDGPDSDGDGLPDNFEEWIGTYTDNPDSDNDGLTDREESDYDGIERQLNPWSEVYNPGGTDTDPMNPDTDGDGFTDGEEVLRGTSPIDPNDFTLHIWMLY